VKIVFEKVVCLSEFYTGKEKDVREKGLNKRANK
jgi:hypothetical protein